MFGRFPPVVALKTVLRGTGFPESAEGRVLSLHRDAINISFGGDIPEAVPVERAILGSLVLQKIDMTASSLLVQSPHEGFRMDDLPMSRGDTAVIRGSAIECAGTWTICLASVNDAPPYDGRISILRPESRRERLRQLASPIAGALLETGRRRGLAPLAAAILGEASPERISAAARDPFVRAAYAALAPALDGADPTASLEKLIGLGIGLTPSGDDFVVGALAARALYGPGALPQRERVGIERRLAHTTIAGASIVRDALDGSFPEYLRRFTGHVAKATLLADEQARTRRVTSAVVQAGAHGHSSGLDAVTGFTFGLTTWRSGGIVIQ